jgi:hypothetical protein
VGDELDMAIIRFQDHKLYLKVLTGGTLCILADETVNMPALRMAANLVGRRIGAELAREDVDGVAALSTAQVEPATVPAEVATAPARSPRLAPPGMRRFRGHTLE